MDLSRSSWQDLSSNLVNKKVAITLPRIAFELTGISYDATRKLSPVTLELKADGNNAVRKMYTPVPYNLEFSLSILSKTNDEGSRDY